MSGSRRLVALIAFVAIALAGCTRNDATRPDSEQPSLVNTLELMERARRANGEEWLRLHNVLAGAAVMNPHPVLRARVALALAVGERESEELERAERLMNALLDDDRTGDGELPEAMRDLLMVQRDLVAERRANRAQLAALEEAAARRRALLSHESASHARTRAERDEARTALLEAQEKLRQVTRIELRQQASGS